MKRSFGTLPSGEQASLYTISCGKLTASVTDFGATLVSLLVPDCQGNIADVVLGCDDAAGYIRSTSYLGCTVGRNANRIGGASFPLNGKTVRIPANEGNNNLHSGPDCYHLRLWEVVEHTASSISFRLFSPDGDQGYPGNATITVTYSISADNALCITYDGICDKDTVFNLTNHSYFNLAGHDKTDAAMDQILKRFAQKSQGYDNSTVFLAHGDCPEDAQVLAARLKEEYGVQEVVTGYVGPVIGAHTGPGVLVIFFLGNER